MEQTLSLLEGFAAEGFFLHGSRRKIGILEPQQAHCLSGREEGCQKAVYAARGIEIPCIMAMRKPDGSKLNPRSSYSRQGKGPLIVKGKHMTFGPGYVYVLKPDTFEEMGGEWISKVPVQQHFVAQVTPDIIPLLLGVVCHIPVPTTW